MRGHARRRDNNEPEVVEALRRAGAAVQRLDGRGLPDLLVSFANELYLIEVKEIGDGRVQPHRGDGNTLTGLMSALTPAQREWWAHWRGKLPVIVTNAQEALRAIGVKTGP